ncbi:MAG: chemotaxis protein CheB [Syntrophothermus sp.]
MKKKLIVGSQPKPVDPDTVPEESSSFPIIGIGASAGGLEALEQFFMNMPVNCRIAFVVIQHLAPDHKGMLKELLQRITEMAVHTVTDRMKVRPNNVYIIPPNRNMSILNGTLHLFEPVLTTGIRLPIDFFFRSLADDLREAAVGVVLSGMGSDGSIGVRAIKEVGGIVLVQDPASAKYDSMPKNAIDTVISDVIAPANELPEKLIEIFKHTPVLPVKSDKRKVSSILEKIIILMRIQTGNDFSRYKKNTLYRRIERRMGIHKISKIASYVKFLQENNAEVDILFKELLIGVTSFFRDFAVWDRLKKKFIPDLYNRLPHGHIVRAWVAGCSTGEEAYSLAIVFKEAQELLGATKHLNFQIFATDLDSSAIEKARKGLFPANIAADVSIARLSKYFVKQDDLYRISNEIREMVIFAPHNLIRDPPFTKLDFVSCRNLLIYLESDLQRKIITMFHYSLNPGGILVLGTAETNTLVPDNFTMLDSKLRIYQLIGPLKNEELMKLPIDFSKYPREMKTIPTIIGPDNIQNLTDQILMQQFAPPGVLVTADGDIIYISGSTGRFLTPAAGKANMNIFSMARENLRSELPVAIRKVSQGNEKVFLSNIFIETDGGSITADITLQKIEKPIALKGKILIIFNELPPRPNKGKKPSKKNLAETGSGEEIMRLRDELQSTREEMQTSQEELKSTNEELQSTNEELQSTNEELTTSKEEMQSLNEELQTVNSELQKKIDDLARVNNDMSNLLNSIEIATLFLDRNLKIRQYTIPATKIFKLIPSDIGRLFTDQVTELIYPRMLEDAREVLRSLIFIEKSVPTIDGRWFSIRILPYRTMEDRIEGLVITYIEITDRKRVEDNLNETLLLYNTLLNDARFVIINLDSSGKITQINPEAERLFGTRKKEVQGCDFYDTFIEDKQSRFTRDKFKAFIDSKEDSINLDIKFAHNPEKIKWSLQKIKKDNDLIYLMVFGEKSP